MTLETGTRLDRYEILEALASGDAYKASDTSAQRIVTIRPLGPDVSADPERSARLERETGALASLDHEGIARVYGVVSQDDACYLVTEYLEGESLAQRLRRGPLGLAEALRVAIALAAALDQAHRKGIVHRHLSPGSVLLAAGGVKVLDFGLGLTGAGAGPAATPMVSMASTRTVMPSAMAAATGAMPYQAPEQLDGGSADARADVFAFGAILYEMLTGEPAFGGKTRALLIAAITTVDPDPVSGVQPLAPPALDYLVGRCLAKDPGKRLQTMRDVLFQLEWIAGGRAGEGGLAASIEARTQRDRRVRIGLASAVVLALGLAPLVYWSSSKAPAPREARFIVSDLGFALGAATATPQLSPNGRWLIASRGLTDGLDALALDSVTKQILLYGHAVFLQFWNPANGEEVAFWEGGFLKKALVSGGDATNIVEVPQPFGGGSWSPDGVIVYSSRGLLYRVRDTGGVPVAITAPDESQQETEHLWPAFLPDGRHFLYLALSSNPGNSAIYVGSLDSDERIRLFEADSRPWYAAPGYILFNRADVVFAQPFDPDRLTLGGEPHRIVDGLSMGGPSLAGEITGANALNAAFSVSGTGLLAYRMGAAGGGIPNAAGAGQPLSLVWLEVASYVPLAGIEGTFAGIDLAPDDRRFAVHRHEPNGGDIWIYDPDQGGMRRWTLDSSQENSSPVWSPDADRIAFASRRNGRWGIYVKAVDGTGDEIMLVEGDVPLAPMSWTPGGEVVYWVRNATTGDDIFAVGATGEESPRAVIATGAPEQFPQASPDGNWIAYQKPDDAGTTQIWVNSFPNPQGGGWQITNEGGTFPRWRGDGQALRLFYLDPPGVHTVDLRVAGGAIQPSGAPDLLVGIANPNLQTSDHYNPAVSYYRYDVSGDGRRFLVPQPQAAAAGAGGGAAPIAETLRNLADAGGTAVANEIAVILDWTRLLPED